MNHSIEQVKHFLVSKNDNPIAVGETFEHAKQIVLSNDDFISIYTITYMASPTITWSFNRANSEWIEEINS
jgi:hypothetical protein